MASTSGFNCNCVESLLVLALIVSRVFNDAFASASELCASACVARFNSRIESTASRRRMSRPAAVTVICSGRDSPLLPFKSVATSFIVSKSPGFTLSGYKSQ